MKKKNIDSIMSIGLFSLALILGYQNRVDTTMVREIPVKIIGKDNENVKKYIEDIDNIDDYLIGLAEVIILTDRPLSSCGITKAEIPLKANAMTIPYKKEICIQTGTYDSLTLSHEFYHLLDYEQYLKTGQSYSEDAKFRETAEKYWNELMLSDYQSSTWQEVFVACMVRYRYIGDEMRERMPDLYFLIDEMVGKTAEG